MSTRRRLTAWRMPAATAARLAASHPGERRRHFQFMGLETGPMQVSDRRGLGGFSDAQGSGPQVRANEDARF